MTDKDLHILVNQICRKWTSEGSNQSSLIPILQEIQKKVGYLPMEALEIVSNNLGIPPSHIYGVATFYHQFRLRPQGKHIITVCMGTACHVAGATEVYNFLLRHLGITLPEDTTTDGLFTVKQVRCIGACSLAHMIKIDDEVYGGLDLKDLQRLLQKYREMGKER